MHEAIVNAGYRVSVCTPDGKAPELRTSDEAAERWVNDNKQLFSNPLRLEEVRASDYCGICTPCGMGAISDLAQSSSLGLLVESFLTANKPICCVGQGVAALCRAGSSADNDWCFAGWNLTATSNFEQARHDWFGELPLIIEDFVKDCGGLYSSSEEDACHVVVDRNLITGQNPLCTDLAVQNFLWVLESHNSNN